MSVRVVARIRPLLKQELDKDTIVTAEALEGETTPTVVRLPSPKNDAESFSFQFSSVYEQDASQQQLFDAESGYSSPDAFDRFLTISSCTNGQELVQWLRLVYLRARLYRYRKDTYNARWKVAG